MRARSIAGNRSAILSRDVIAGLLQIRRRVPASPAAGYNRLRLMRTRDRSSSRDQRHVFGAVALGVAAVVIAILTSSGWGPRQHAVPVAVPAAPAATPGAATAGAAGAVDAPSGELVIGTKVPVSGWALDPAG